MTARSKRYAKAPADPAPQAAPVQQPDAGNQARQNQYDVKAEPTADGGVIEAFAKSERDDGKGKTASEEVRAQGGLTVTRALVPDTEPPEYIVTTTLELGVGVSAKRARETSRPAGGAGGTAGKGTAPTSTRTASVEGSASASGTYTHERRVDQATYERLLDALDAATEGGVDSAFPEARMVASEVARWSGALEAVDEMVEQVAGDPAGARALGAGDAFSLVLSAGAEGSAAMGSENAKSKLSVGAGVQGSVAWERILKVDREGPRAMVVSLGFVDASKLAASASASNAYAGMTLDGSIEQSSDKHFTFELDPDHAGFDRDYSSIVGSFSPEAAGALIARLESGRLREGLFSETQARSHGASATGAGATFDHGVRAEGSETTRYADGQLEFDNRGAFSDRAGLDAGLFGSTESTETSEVDGTLEDGEASIDLKSTKDGLLKSVELSTEEFDALVIRARDSDAWRRHAVNAPPVMGAWKALRRGLRSPTLRDIEAALDPEAAEEIGQLRAVSSFIQTAGHEGMSVLERCLNWGGRVLGSQIEAFEHDPGMDGWVPGGEERLRQSEDWEYVITEGPRLAADLEKYVEKLELADTPEGNWELHAQLRQIDVDAFLKRSERTLDDIQREREGRALVDMTERVNDIRADVRNAMLMLHLRGSSDRPIVASPEEIAALEARMEDLRTALLSFKAEEVRRLQAVYSEFDRDGDSYEASAGLAEVDEMGLRWQLVFQDYWQCCKSADPGQDTQKAYDRALLRYGPSVEMYNKVNELTRSGLARGFVTEKTEPFRS